MTVEHFDVRRFTVRAERRYGFIHAPYSSRDGIFQRFIRAVALFLFKPIILGFRLAKDGENNADDESDNGTDNRADIGGIEDGTNNPTAELSDEEANKAEADGSKDFADFADYATAA
jgi:hypothetical protein